MMSKLITLLSKEFWIIVRDKVGLLLSFLLPLVMIVIFGFVFGGENNDDVGVFQVLAVNQDEGPAGKRLITNLDALAEIEILQKAQNDSVLFDSLKARNLVESGKKSIAIIIPKNFSERLRKGEVKLTILEDPRDKITTGVVYGLLQKQVFSQFPALLPSGMLDQSSFLMRTAFNQDLRRILKKNFDFEPPDTLSTFSVFPESWILGSDPDTSVTNNSSAQNFDQVMDDIFKVDRIKVAGQKIVNPGIAQSVAGPSVLFLLFSVGGIAASLLREMRDGTALRLITCRVSPSLILFSKYIWAVMFGSLQLVVMMICGKLIFGLNIFARPLELLAIIVCTAAATGGLGLFIAAISKTEEQAHGYQVISNLALSAIGGAMFPSFMIPSFIRSLAAFTPVDWAMQGFLDIFWRDQSFSDILPECSVLLGMSAVLVFVATTFFNRRLATELG